jgi:hypothetical protein
MPDIDPEVAKFVDAIDFSGGHMLEWTSTARVQPEKWEEWYLDTRHKTIDALSAFVKARPEYHL